MLFFFLIFGSVCLFLGGIFFLVFRRSRARHETLSRTLTAEAWAKLTDTESRTEYDIKNRAHTVFYGVYEYDTADGQHLSAPSDFGYHDAAGIPGTQGRPVKIRYNPKHPEEFALTEEQAVSETIWPKFRKVALLLIVLCSLPGRCRSRRSGASPFPFGSPARLRISPYCKQTAGGHKMKPFLRDNLGQDVVKYSTHQPEGGLP